MVECLALLQVLWYDWSKSFPLNQLMNTALPPSPHSPPSVSHKHLGQTLSPCLSSTGAHGPCSIEELSRMCQGRGVCSNHISRADKKDKHDHRNISSEANNTMKRELQWLSVLGNLWWCFQWWQEEVKEGRILYQSLPCISCRPFPSESSVINSLIYNSADWNLD